MSALTEAHLHDFLPAPVRAIAPYWVLALIVFAAYGNIYDNAFLFDDDLIITLNTYLRGWSHIGDILTGSTISGAHIAGGFYRPMQILLYLLAFHAGDGSSFWFHTLNLALHAANTCFVYRLGTKLGFDARGVFLAALVWGLHPLHTEAVTYMSATADPLFAFFCLWAIIVLLPDFTPRKILITFPLFLLGLLSKETAVMFPLLVMACLFYTSPQRLDFRLYRRTIPFWIVALAYVFWRTHAAGFDGPQTYAHYYALPQFSDLKMYAEHPIDRVYTFFATLPFYLKLLIWPTGLHMERSFTIYRSFLSIPVAAGLTMVVFALAHCVHSCRANAWIEMSWGFLWFAAAHAPDTGLLVPMNSLFLEHWMYLPTVGLLLGLAQTVVGLTHNHARAFLLASGAATIGWAICFFCMTYDQNKLWHDPVVFYNNIFAYGENSARAHNNLALYYSDHGQYTKAIEQFDLAIKVSDTYAETRYNLALTYLRNAEQENYVAKAIQNLQRSLELEPGFYRSYQALGNVYDLLLHDKDKAASYRAKAEALFNRRQ